MTLIYNRIQNLRKRLIKQAADMVDMSDYRQQLRAYQEIMLEIIDIEAELARLAGVALRPQEVNESESEGDS